MIKIIIADDHPFIIEGLKAYLTTESNIEIVGEANNGQQVLNLLMHTAPDIVLLDISMPGMTGIELTEKIKQQYPSVKIIVLTMHSKKEYVLELMRLGISGYILKSKGSEEVATAIAKVYQGKTHFGEEVMEFATAPGLSAPILGQLTEREEEILTLIGECMTSKQIAEKLFIATPTVETHVRNLLGKLSLDNRMHLVRYAVENGYTNSK